MDRRPPSKAPFPHPAELTARGRHQVLHALAMDQGDRWRALYDLAVPRDGVTVIEDARCVGIADRTYWARAQREQWEQLGGGARLLPGARASTSARRHAALVVLGPEALLSHRTALHVHELTAWAEPDDRVHVVIPYSSTTEPPNLTRRHRSRRLAEEDRTVVGGFRVTSLARTLIDVATGVTDWRLEAMMMAARQRRILTADDLRDQLGRRPTLRGAARFRRALATLDLGPVDSILEARTLRLLRDHGIDEPSLQHPIHDRGRRVVADFAWPDRRVVLECDGRAFHGDEQFQRDRDRWNLIRDAGWRLAWATWTDVHQRPTRVIARIRRNLDRA